MPRLKLSLMAFTKERNDWRRVDTNWSLTNANVEVVKSKLMELQTSTSGKQDRPFDSILASTAWALCNNWAWPRRFISMKELCIIQSTGKRRAANNVLWQDKAPEAPSAPRPRHTVHLPSVLTRIASPVVRALQSRIDSSWVGPKGEAYEVLAGLVLTYHFKNGEAWQICAFIKRTIIDMRKRSYICAEDV
jgi:hypothetical protein